MVLLQPLITSWAPLESFPGIVLHVIDVEQMGKEMQFRAHKAAGTDAQVHDFHIHGTKAHAFGLTRHVRMELLPLDLFFPFNGKMLFN